MLDCIKGFRIVILTGFWICVRTQMFRIYQVFAYVSVTKGSEDAWIWLSNAWRNYSDNDRVLNIAAQNFTAFWIWLRFEICHCFEFGKVVKGYARCWICLDKLKYALIMPQYVWIYLGNAEYAWICLYIPK